MRIVPLIAALGLLPGLALAVEEIGVYAGRNRTALKLQNEGVVCERKGDDVNARKNFDEAIRIDPTMWPAYFDRAQLDRKERKFQQMLRDANNALRGNPSFAYSVVLRAEAYLQLRMYEAAARDLDRIINSAPRGTAYSGALNDSAWLRATCPEPRYRNAQLAVKHATLACSLSSNKKADYVDTLAAAYAEVGDFDAAVRSEEKALAIGNFFHEPKESRQHMNEHLASFKQHRPWRDNPTN